MPAANGVIMMLCPLSGTPSGEKRWSTTFICADMQKTRPMCDVCNGRGWLGPYGDDVEDCSFCHLFSPPELDEPEWLVLERQALGEYERKAA